MGILPRLDTVEDAARRKHAHADLAGYYQRMAALFHQLMVEARERPRDSLYPLESVLYFQSVTRNLNRMARSELGRCIKLAE